MQSELQRAWSDFEKARADLQRDIPGLVCAIDKHEELVRLRLDQMEQNLLRKNIWTDLASAIPNRAKKVVRENYGWLLVALALSIYFGVSESRESCIESASKRPTDAGARIAYGECDKRFPKASK